MYVLRPFAVCISPLTKKNPASDDGHPKRGLLSHGVGELQSRHHPSLSAGNEEDHPEGGRDCPGEINPRERVVTHPCGVQGAQIRGEYTDPEEQRLRHALGIPQTTCGRDVGDEANALHEDVGGEGVLGNEPEHDHSRASHKAQSLHAIEGNREGAALPVELDDVVQDIDNIERAGRHGNIASPRLAWTLPVHPT